MAKDKKSEPTKVAAPAKEALGQESATVSPNAPLPVEPVAGNVGVAGASAAANLDAEVEHHLLYKGAAGQMAVMAEFLYRLLNVAVPEVDVGDDVFVVREKDEAVTRVQVKYSKADEQQNGSYVTQFTLPWDQFDLPNDTPALVYVLAVRHKDHWTDFIVIRRSVLRQLQADHDVGSVVKNKAGDPIALGLRLVFTTEGVSAKGGFGLQKYRNAFKPWPPPQLTDTEAEGQIAADGANPEAPPVDSE